MPATAAAGAMMEGRGLITGQSFDLNTANFATCLISKHKKPRNRTSDAANLLIISLAAESTKERSKKTNKHQPQADHMSDATKPKGRFFMSITYL